MYDWTLRGVGLVTVSVISIRFLRFIWLYTKPSALERYTRKGGAWALVTGSTHGIGLEYARQLAAKGFNVLLHGRDTPKLDKVCRELEASHPALQFRTIAADCSRPTEVRAAVDTVLTAANSLPGELTVLVNNVGGLNFVLPFTNFEEYSETDYEAILNVNARFPAWLTRALVPTLSRNTPALILFVGSMAGTSGVPLVCDYSACKGYIFRLAQSLSREFQLRDMDIEVLSTNVGITTDTAGVRDPPSLFVPRAKTLVQASLKRVGCGRPLVTPHLGHAVQYFFLQALPGPLQSLILNSDVAEKAKYEHEVRQPQFRRQAAAEASKRMTAEKEA